MADYDMTDADAQDHAEEVDDEMIRLDPHGLDPDGLAGVNDTDRGPMSSEDPSLLLGGSETQDESHTREWRERDEVRPEDVGTRDARRPAADDLVEPAGSTVDDRDIEKTLIGETSRSDHDGTVPPAEVDAISLTDPHDR